MSSLKHVLKSTTKKKFLASWNKSSLFVLSFVCQVTYLPLELFTLQCLKAEINFLNQITTRIHTIWRWVWNFPSKFHFYLIKSYQMTCNFKNFFSTSSLMSGITFHFPLLAFSLIEEKTKNQSKSKWTDLCQMSSNIFFSQQIFSFS